MTTCLDVIKDALIWRGVLDAGREADAGDAASGLTALKGIYQQICKARLLTPVTVSADYTAGENERIANTDASSVTITLPEVITLDSAITLPDGTTTLERAPLDRSVVVVSGGAAVQTFLYDADQADWIDVESLTLTSEAPLAGSYANGLAAALCVRLRYPGVLIDQSALTAAAGFKAAIFGRWDVERPALAATYY